MRDTVKRRKRARASTLATLRQETRTEHIADLIFATVALSWSAHIVLFRDSSPATRAMQELSPQMVWFVGLLSAGVLQVLGVAGKRAWMRGAACLLQIFFYGFVTLAFAIHHVYIPGLMICPGYMVWLFVILLRVSVPARKEWQTRKAGGRHDAP